MEDIKGFKVTRNSLKHPVVWLHYSADPAKDPDTATGKTWLEREEKRYYGGKSGLKWRSEMEMDFNAGLGELVFPDLLDLQEKIYIDPFTPSDSYVLYGGMDWGTRNPVSFHVYAESPEKRFYAVWEFYTQRASPIEVAKAIKECPYYDRLQWIASDPTMWSETIAKKDGFTSIAEMMTDEDTVGDYTIDKLMPSHGRSDETAINKVKNMLVTETPEFGITKLCPNMWEELKNLKYPDRQELRNETEKIMDKNNHAWDDFKYFLLSHPFASKEVVSPQFGTVAYYNKISEFAEQAAKRKGTSIQDEFNNLWGMVI